VDGMLPVIETCEVVSKAEIDEAGPLASSWVVYPYLVEVDEVVSSSIDVDISVRYDTGLCARAGRAAPSSHAMVHHSDVCKSGNAVLKNHHGSFRASCFGTK